MLRPTNPSIAGSSVSAASIVMRTPIDDADGQAVHDRHAHREQAEHGDDDRRAGEQHGPAGRVDRRDDRLLGVESVVQALAVAGDDEQRVVDADADRDHRHGLLVKLGMSMTLTARPTSGDAGADAEERGDHRQAHREHRAERDEQDDDRGEEADALAAELGRLGELVALELDLSARRPRPPRRARVPTLPSSIRSFGVAVGHLDLGVGDRAGRTTQRSGARCPRRTG